MNLRNSENSPNGDPIETFTPFTLITTQKDNINLDQISLN